MASQVQTDQDEELDRMVKDFFDSGGTVTKFKKYARSEDIEYTTGWGKKRKKSVDPDKK